MKKSEIIRFLSENELADVEDVKYKDGIVVVRFFYDFDDDEIKAAKAYANEESDFETESEEWYRDYVLPYLNEIAIDNVEDVINDAKENFEIEGQFISYDIDLVDYNYNEFIAIFYDEDKDVDIDEVLDDLELV